MRDIILDFTGAISRDDIHNVLASALNFPEYYGRNLDALHDMLSTSFLGEEVSFEITGLATLPEELRAYSEKMVKVFSDVAISFEDYETEDGTVMILKSVN